jgi:ribosome-associated toxin RatA of RatAB toxin-antitoxin module
MSKSLLFIPDISGFTKFVQTTEVEHSQHVIAELLEVLISANTQELELAEVEGDALFFYKEEELSSQERLLGQIETMFTAFYGHLKLLEKNRICPCNACATAHSLHLKIVAHSGELQFIQVQGNRKPFGQQVIEAHRLLKNSIDSDHYALISKELANDLELPIYYYSKVYRFREGKDSYDGKEVAYIYSLIDIEKLNLASFSQAKKVGFEVGPNIVLEQQFPISAESLFEYITNYTYRHYWVKGVEKFEYNENEVTRLGTDHTCVINGKHFNFISVTKKVRPDQLVYGELTDDTPLIDKLYQFYIIDPVSSTQCRLKLELYWESKSFFKKTLFSLVIGGALKKNAKTGLNGLLQFVTEKLEPQTG